MRARTDTHLDRQNRDGAGAGHHGVGAGASFGAGGGASGGASGGAGSNAGADGQPGHTRSHPDLLRALAIATWLVIWQLVSLAVGSHLLLAGPIETIQSLIRLIGETSFWLALVFSFIRITLGFISAFIVALLFAALASRSAFAQELIVVGLGSVKSVPVVCIVVLLLMLVGARNVSVIAVFLVALPALYFAASEALANMDAGMKELLDACSLRSSRQLFGHIWPSMQPYLFAVCKNVVGMSWKAGVAAELIGMPLGSIGERVYQTKLLLETGELFAWTIVIVVLASLSERVFLALLAASNKLALRLATRRLPRALSGAAAEAVPADSAAEIVFQDVSLSFGETQIVDSLNLRVPPGARICLDEPSGVGKTSLLRLVAQSLKPDTGQVLLVESSHHSNPSVSVMPQETHLIESVSALDNVAFFAGDYLCEQEIRDLLGQLLEKEHIDKPVSELSGGQRRRVELVRAMARPSQIVLLDEPFSSLDSTGAHKAAQFIQEQLKGRSLLVASHMENTAQLLACTTMPSPLKNVD